MMKVDAFPYFTPSYQADGKLCTQSRHFLNSFTYLVASGLFIRLLMGKGKPIVELTWLQIDQKEITLCWAAEGFTVT